MIFENIYSKSGFRCVYPTLEGVSLNKKVYAFRIWEVPSATCAIHLKANPQRYIDQSSSFYGTQHLFF